MTATSIAAYLVLFATVGFLFLFVALLLGRFLRARVPTAEKLEPYECGEPPVGSSFVQFDLRFYVVALVFIIFEVEVAFFFPWATVFGKATELMNPAWAKVEHGDLGWQLSQRASDKLGELGVKDPQLPDPSAGAEENVERMENGARNLALASMADMAVFFAVLLVGFAYVWYRGDLNWVRAATRPPSATDTLPERPLTGPRET